MNQEINLTREELAAIADYTVQKINNYPARLGKTVENYFDILYPNEIRDYIARREINMAFAVRVQEA